MCSAVIGVGSEMLVISVGPAVIGVSSKTIKIKIIVWKPLIIKRQHICLEISPKHLIPHMDEN